MILQALVTHYEDLVARGAVSPPGWSGGKVSFVLYLDENGALTQVVSAKTVQKAGTKEVLAPQTMEIPAPVKRSVNVAANFLCDHSGYLLGVDGKGKPARTRKCFEACRALHLQLLQDVDSPGARALVRFFEAWDPAQAAEHPALREDWEELISGGNLVFRYGDMYLQDDPAIRRAWEAHYLSAGDGPEMVCLVTGKRGPVEAVHPAIKGIKGAQSSGASLVSFNAPAFCSYGKEQNYNAPTSQYAAFAYTSALNHLIADRDHVFYIGDTAVLAWAEGAAPAYQGMLCGVLCGMPQPYSEEELWQKAACLAAGEPVEFHKERLDPDRTFYILGIAPNAARLSVRFFLKNSFGSFIRNVEEHQQRLNIVRPVYDPFPTLPLWRLLGETVNQNAKEKTASPNMAGEVLRAILMNTRYPATLLNGVNLRIQAEHEITRGRAAIIKAYYSKNQHKDVPEEVLTVYLNPESICEPYQLGRLFAVLEDIQSAANPGINTTIKDKYFDSAAAMPARIFPMLMGLAEKHLKKLRRDKPGMAIARSRELRMIVCKLGEYMPETLSLAQRSSFQLGYYHQVQARYQGKSKEEA